METNITERWQSIGLRFRGPNTRESIKTQRLIQQKASTVKWGRNNDSSWLLSTECLFMFSIPPTLTIIGWITLEHFHGSLLAVITAIYKTGSWAFFKEYTPSATPATALGYCLWVIFQSFLYTYLPGWSTGQLTPAGHLLHYRTNGLLACVITVMITLLAIFFDVLDLGIISDHWEGLLAVLNIYGLLLTAMAYIKAHFWPSHPADRKFSGSPLYDILMGIEFNPRFGEYWDWKLFHNGRPGMIGWLLINLSFGMTQYRAFGRITNSTIIVNLLQAIYVIDFLVYESWYLRTIDICHDHFGFYLAWGSAAFLPTMYTLQTQYLARHDVQLSNISAVLILSVGLGGYALFRSVNQQKDLARRTKGQCRIWGKQAKFIRCTFATTDGKKHESLLLVSGWWAYARHVNYVGDLMLSYSMCAVCGFNHLLPWFYALYMTTILVHRCFRDEQRCQAKYGEQWDQYCKLVPWRLLPGLW